jgi:cell division septum initiation protein DivIVA
MSNEELTDVQDELEAARAEVEALQVTAADRAARAAHLESELAELQRELQQARGEAEERDRLLAEQAGRAGALESQVRAAAERYRAVVLSQAPELEELVAGDTVDEIDASVARARETVSKVRGQLESEAQAGRVPVGAPPRRPPDLSGLTPAEKIERGLAGRG